MVPPGGNIIESQARGSGRKTAVERTGKELPAICLFSFWKFLSFSISGIL